MIMVYFNYVGQFWTRLYTKVARSSLDAHPDHLECVQRRVQPGNEIGPLSRGGKEPWVPRSERLWDIDPCTRTLQEPKDSLT